MAPRRPQTGPIDSKGALALSGPSYAVTKRSVTLRGRRTSISLEAPFWEMIRVAARENDLTISVLVDHIDRARGDNNLSSALRVFAFLYVQGAIPREALRFI